VAIVIGHVGGNLWQFLLVRGRLRGLVALALVQLVGFLAFTVPLLAAFDVAGYGVALALTAAVGLAVRAVLVRDALPDVSMVRHGLRALAPTLLATAGALAALPLPDGVRIGIFGAIVLASVAVLERRLVTEAA